MSLKERLRQDLTTAIKARDELRSSTLRMVLAAITNAEVAGKHGVSPQQGALAWELAISPAVVPIPGASRPESVQDSFRATELVLDEDDLAALSRA